MIQSLKWQESLPRHCRHIQWPAGAWPWADHRLSPPCSGRTGWSRCAWACTCPAAELPLKQAHNTHSRLCPSSLDFWCMSASILSAHKPITAGDFHQGWWADEALHLPLPASRTFLYILLSFAVSHSQGHAPYYYLYPYKLHQRSCEHALSSPSTWSPSTKTVKY